MVTLEEYNAAVEIVEKYDRERIERGNLEREIYKAEQLKKEQECGEHYFLERGKWQSGMQCQHCGKIIE